MYKLKKNSAWQVNPDAQLILVMLIATMEARPGVLHPEAASLVRFVGPETSPLVRLARPSSALVEDFEVIPGPAAPAISAHPTYLANPFVSPVITGYSHSAFYRAPPALVAAAPVSVAVAKYTEPLALTKYAAPLALTKYAGHLPAAPTRVVAAPIRVF